MAKVVTESPRRGHGMPSAKFGGKIRPQDADDESNARIRPHHDIHKASSDRLQGGRIPWSRHRNIESKDFSDLLGPLRGYLRKQVGRPWNTIWSELSATLDKRSLTGIHIFDHIKSEVAIDTFLIGKDVWAGSRFGYRHRAEGLFVHPRTGLLCWRKEHQMKHFDRHGEWDLLRRLQKLDLVPSGHDVGLVGMHEPQIIQAPRFRTHLPARQIRVDVRDWRILKDGHGDHTNSDVFERRHGVWFLHSIVHYNPKKLVPIRTLNDQGESVVEMRTRADLKLPLYSHQMRTASRKLLKLHKTLLS